MLHQTIKNEIKEAMRARDQLRLETLRGLSAMFQNEVIMGKTKTVSKDGEEFLPDEATLSLVKRSVKQRKDSIEQFQKGGREDLVAKEKEELSILESYLPKMMSREEVRKVVGARIEKMKAESMFDPKAGGKITGMMMKELAGKADGADVKAAVDEVLAK